MAGHVVQANQSPEVVLASLVQECPSASSSFFLPFIYIFLLAFPGSDFLHNSIVEKLEGCWNTFYGVSMVVNGLVGVELPTAPRGSKTKPHQYGFYASFLFFSAFGEAICALCDPAEPPQLQSIVVKFQRFMFKLCELRKCTNLYRSLWRLSFREYSARTKWVEEVSRSYTLV